MPIVVFSRLHHGLTVTNNYNVIICLDCFKYISGVVDCIHSTANIKFTCHIFLQNCVVGCLIIPCSAIFMFTMFSHVCPENKDLSNYKNPPFWWSTFSFSSVKSSVVSQRAYVITPSWFNQCCSVSDYSLCFWWISSILTPKTSAESSWSHTPSTSTSLQLALQDAGMRRWT